MHPWDIAGLTGAAKIPRTPARCVLAKAKDMSTRPHSPTNKVDPPMCGPATTAATTVFPTEHRHKTTLDPEGRLQLRIQHKVKT